jgi:hypothetical protein
MEVQSGGKTRLWEDTWLGWCALRIEFNQLYKTVSNDERQTQNKLRTVSLDIKNSLQQRTQSEHAFWIVDEPRGILRSSLA